MKKYNFEYSFKASKNGNYRSIFVPEELQPILEEVKITYAYKSIQNLFKNFEIFFKSKHPDFKKRITAHILRAQLITNMHMRGLNLGEIQCATGHVNQAVISSRYIKTNSNYHKQTTRNREYGSIRGFRRSKNEERDKNTNSTNFCS
ncbi:Phage integrase family [Chlamydia trachomatis]|nr:Phage integrase family [Chlamydia trachomatis]CRH47308.1 Phage integrase family [Chlamydia trachomatis]CRH54993.1 Phage integrase family [Chlamydia trachomatis]